MKIGNLLFIILAVLVPAVVLIRWIKAKKRPHHPLLIDKWTGAMEMPQEAEQTPLDSTDADFDGEAEGVLASEIVAHCESFFRVQAHTFQTVADIEIAEFPPTNKRGWWTYVTLNLHHETGVELVMYSYLQEKQIVRHLAQVATTIKAAWKPGDAGVSEGDTFALEGPLVEGSRLDYLLATAPYFEKEGFDYYTNGVQTVRMLMLHPISASEVRYLNQYGQPALEAKFAEHEVNSLDFYRIPLAEGGSLGESDPDESDRSGGASGADSADSGKERQ